MIIIKSSASKVASGLINPVTGRRVVTTWMADELLPFAWKEYSAIGKIIRPTIHSAKKYYLHFLLRLIYCRL